MIRRLVFASLFAACCALAQQQLQLSLLPAGPIYEPGQSIDFGTVPVGTPNSVAFRLANDGPARVILTRLLVDGAAFQLGRTPVGLAIPVGQSIEFTITFTPWKAGPARLGQLWVRIAGQPQAEYDLAGTGAEAAAGSFVEPRAEAVPEVTPAPTPTPTPTPTPAWPKASIAAQPALASDEQSTISIQFEAPLPVDGAGTLSMDHTGGGDTQRGFILPDSNGTFVPSQVSFTLSAGESVARFMGHSGIVFQAGSSASTLTFTAALGDGTRLASQSFTIAPAAVGIDLVRLEASGNGVIVTVDAFDNTGTASTLSYIFYDTANRQIGQAIPVDATAQFHSYFTNAGTGLFGLKQAFNVAGDVSAIGAVAVSVANSQGTSSKMSQ
jgi:hypothetical protein